MSQNTAILLGATAIVVTVVGGILRDERRHR